MKIETTKKHKSKPVSSKQDIRVVKNIKHDQITLIKWLTVANTLILLGILVKLYFV